MFSGKGNKLFRFNMWLLKKKCITLTSVDKIVFFQLRLSKVVMINHLQAGLNKIYAPFFFFNSADIYSTYLKFRQKFGRTLSLAERERKLI